MTKVILVYRILSEDGWDVTQDCHLDVLEILESGEPNVTFGDGVTLGQRCCSRNQFRLSYAHNLTFVDFHFHFSTLSKMTHKWWLVCRGF